MERFIAVCLVVSGVCITFILTENPRCLNKISDVTALIDSTVFLPCDVQGKPVPTYEWRKVGNQTLLLLGLRFTPSNKGLIIHNVRQEDGGKYQVKLENDEFFYHSAITLHVKGIDFIRSARIKSVKAKSSVSLSCGKRPTRTSSNIKWLDSTGRDVSNLKRYNVHNSGSLIIEPVKTFDTGQYTCKNTTKMDGGYLEESLEWYLNVQYEARIIIIKPLVEVLQNATIMFPCTSIGNPAPGNQWLFPNGSVIRTNGKFKTFDNGSVLIFNVQIENDLQYKCVSSNGIGRNVYKYTRLRVLVPPLFSTHPDTNILVDKGDAAMLDCTSSGIPQADTTWKFLNGSVEVYNGMKYHIKSVRTVHAGIYICFIRSKAGRLNRTFIITIKGKPAIPTSFSVKVIDTRLLFHWSADRNGGSDQTFELWHRSDSQSDYEWKSLSTNHTSYNTTSDEEVIERSKVIYCSVRARNNKGYSGFSHVIQLSYIPNNSQLKILKKLSDSPLAPYNFTVNNSKDGYILKWKHMLTPGRPRVKSFVVEYREDDNMTVWKVWNPRNNRTTRSVSTTTIGELNVMFIPAKTIYGVIQFRVYAIAYNDKKSEASITQVTRDVPFVGDNASSRRRQTDIIPPIVLGVIFLFFFVILIVSLYCFCRRKMKRSQARGEAKDKDKNDLILETYSLEFDDESKLFAPKSHYPTDSPTIFHLATCPALTLGKCSKKNPDVGDSDEVYFLLQANEKEITTCTCNKTVKINGRDQTEYKKIEYKTSSSPTVSLTSEGDASSVVPSEGFDDDEDYEISDIEKDCVAELDKVRAQVLKRFKFKDSYDQFCRPVVKDFTVKVPRNNHHIIPTTEKTEVDSNMENNTVDDDSSENSATESERRLKSKTTNDDHIDCNNPKLFDKKLEHSKFEECNSSSSDPDSISFLNTHNNTNEHPNVYNPIHSKRDIGYFSDNPSRISPLFVTSHQQQHYHHPSQKPNIQAPQYYSDDNASHPFRMKHPPTYNQAIIDIERMSDRNEIADSEEMYDHLLRMEKQLGVQLNDSLDSELNASTLPSNYRHPHSKNSSDTGYISDMGTSRDRYSHREKSARCAQLLNEFKSSKPEDLQLMGETSDSPNITNNSVLDDMVSELPKVTPILKRANSTSSNSTHNEWLV